MVTERYNSNQRSTIKTESIENVVLDEANGRTYVVMSDHALSDGELYSAIRLDLLKRKGPIVRGQKVIISASGRLVKPEGSAD